MADPTPQQLAKALTLNERMGEFGFDPSLKRGTLLPFGTNQQGEKEWAVPEIGYGMMKAFVLPGHAAQGGQWTDNDVTDMALNIAGMGGFGSMGLGKAAVGGAGGKVLGAHVYQGGPHKYGPEGAAQSLQHMSKGEGAQAYGWGRYDAGNPAVAKQYAENLARPGLSFQTGEKILAQPSPRGAGARVTNAPDDPVMNTAVNVLNMTEGDIGAALKRLDSFDDAEAIDLLKYWQENPTKAPAADPGKYLYTHDLPDDAIARYLDWDKPMSEQSENVRSALSQLGVEAPSGKSIDQMNGKYLHRMLVGNSADVAGVAGANKAASEALGKAGIPGLRYLDGGSRGAGEGSHNYVTWDQDVLNRMKLLERDGETFGMTGNPAMLVAGQNQDAGPSKMALELAKRLSDQEFYAKGGI